MKLFDVYPRFPITPVKAKGVYVWDENNTRYLDLYGGHGVISIGHSHPQYTKAIENQVKKIGFYSNSIEIPIQKELAEKLGNLSGYPDYALFLCNSGAEANDNAIKLASFYNHKKTVIAFKNSFHGRTGVTLNVTDDPKISASINQDNFKVIYVPLNDTVAFDEAIKQPDVSSVIIEGIQGVGGLDYPNVEFLEYISAACAQHEVILILDEIQSGYGRSGKFFAHQHSAIKPDLITTAKGMGNGFPIAGLLIHPKIEAQKGMLGTTFGGNHLACAAGVAVLDVLEAENLMSNVVDVSAYLVKELATIPQVIKVKGMGLMLGVELAYPVDEVRLKLLNAYQIFTGNAKNKYVLRILPPLGVTKKQVKVFVNALREIVS